MARLAGEASGSPSETLFFLPDRNGAAEGRAETPTEDSGRGNRRVSLLP